MTERDLLLAAVLENPADDTPRLVLADKFDELGGARNQARAELIRVQCEMTRTPPAIDAGEPVYEDIRTDAYGDALIERVFRGYRRPPTTNPAYESLRARQHAILKRWAASFLPKCLRGGYPFARVEGATVWAETLGGYVEFRRGFVERAGCELPLSPGVIGPTALRFGQRLASLFEANPLTEFTVSFEEYKPVLTAEVGPHVTRRQWVVGWGSDTYKALPLAAVEAPFGGDTRHELGRRLAAWFYRAVQRPAEIANAAVLTNEPDEIDVALLSYTGAPYTIPDYTDQLRDEMLQASVSRRTSSTRPPENEATRRFLAERPGRSLSRPAEASGFSPRPQRSATHTQRGLCGKVALTVDLPASDNPSQVVFGSVREAGFEPATSTL